MRGNWTIYDLLDAASGRLVFSTQQDEVIRTEVVRRMGQPKNPQVGELEMASIAR